MLYKLGTIYDLVYKTPMYNIMVSSSAPLVTDCMWVNECGAGA